MDATRLTEIARIRGRVPIDLDRFESMHDAADKIMPEKGGRRVPIDLDRFE